MDSASKKSMDYSFGWIILILLIIISVILLIVWAFGGFDEETVDLVTTTTASTSSAGGIKVSSKLTFDGDISSLANPGALTEFESDFKKTMATTLDVAEEDITIDGISAGSIVVDFSVAAGGARDIDIVSTTLTNILASDSDITVGGFTASTSTLTPIVVGAPAATTTTSTSSASEISRISDTNIGATCADSNADGVMGDIHDCSDHENNISPSPSDISCASIPCTDNECCIMDAVPELTTAHTQSQTQVQAPSQSASSVDNTQTLSSDTSQVNSIAGTMATCGNKNGDPHGLGRADDPVTDDDCGEGYTANPGNYFAGQGIDQDGTARTGGNPCVGAVCDVGNQHAADQRACCFITAAHLRRLRIDAGIRFPRCNDIYGDDSYVAVTDEDCGDGYTAIKGATFSCSTAPSPWGAPPCDMNNREAKNQCCHTNDPALNHRVEILESMLPPPEGWLVDVNDAGDTYYINTLTGESQFDFPIDVLMDQQDQASTSSETTDPASTNTVCASGVGGTTNCYKRRATAQSCPTWHQIQVHNTQEAAYAACEADDNCDAISDRVCDGSDTQVTHTNAPRWNTCNSAIGYPGWGCLYAKPPTGEPRPEIPIDVTGKWELGDMIMRSDYNGALVQAVKYTGEPRDLTWDLQHSICNAANKETPGSDLSGVDNFKSIYCEPRSGPGPPSGCLNKHCAYSSEDNYVVSDKCGWNNQIFTWVEGSLGQRPDRSVAQGFMCARSMGEPMWGETWEENPESGNCLYHVGVQYGRASSLRSPKNGNRTIKTGDSVFCSA